MIPLRIQVLYFAVNEPTIEVMMTMAAMVVAMIGDPYNTAIAIENSPRQIMFAHISRPERAEP